MQRTDIGTGLGIGQQMVKYTLTFTDMVASNSITTISLPTNPGGNALQQPGTVYGSTNAANFVIPQAGWVYYTKVHHTTAFVGSGTQLLVTVGKVGSATNFLMSSFNVQQTAADTTLQEGFAFASGQISAWGVSVTFTAGGGVNATYTAGSVDIYIGYMNVSSPLE